MKSNKQIVFGASISSKACDGFSTEITDVLRESIAQLGITRYRVMTYWDECEIEQGKYNFSKVDELLDIIEEAQGSVTLCLGLRQPRYPECHQPEWAKQLAASEWEAALFDFITKTVMHFRGRDVIVSYQLENEALNKGIGTCQNYSRRRLREEFSLVASLDSTKPIIMSMTNSWGIPLRRPIPDRVGFSMYRHQWGKKGLSNSHRSVRFIRLRKWLMEAVFARPVFCHELQLEPWGPRATQDLPDDQQNELMGPQQLREAIAYATDSGMDVIDMWGLEWWHWRKHHQDDPEAWKTMQQLLSDRSTADTSQ